MSHYKPEKPDKYNKHDKHDKHDKKDKDDDDDKYDDDKKQYKKGNVITVNLKATKIDPMPRNMRNCSKTYRAIFSRGMVETIPFTFSSNSKPT
jgi:hypothetical protein